MNYVAQGQRRKEFFGHGASKQESCRTKDRGFGYAISLAYCRSADPLLRVPLSFLVSLSFFLSFPSLSSSHGHPILSRIPCRPIL